MNLAEYISHETKKTTGNDVQFFFNGQLMGETQTLKFSDARRSSLQAYSTGSSRPVSFTMGDRR